MLCVLLAPCMTSLLTGFAIDGSSALCRSSALAVKQKAAPEVDATLCA